MLQTRKHYYIILIVALSVCETWSLISKLEYNNTEIVEPEISTPLTPEFATVNSKWTFLTAFAQNCTGFHSLTIITTFRAHRNLFNFTTLTIFDDLYKSESSYPHCSLISSFTSPDIFLSICFETRNLFPSVTVTHRFSYRTNDKMTVRLLMINWVLILFN
jgi:hypothetical protein